MAEFGQHFFKAQFQQPQACLLPRRHPPPSSSHASCVARLDVQVRDSCCGDVHLAWSKCHGLGEAGCRVLLTGPFIRPVRVRVSFRRNGTLPKDRFSRTGQLPRKNHESAITVQLTWKGRLYLVLLQRYHISGSRRTTTPCDYRLMGFVEDSVQLEAQTGPQAYHAIIDSLFAAYAVVCFTHLVLSPLRTEKHLLGAFGYLAGNGSCQPCQPCLPKHSQPRGLQLPNSRKTATKVHR